MNLGESDDLYRWEDKGNAVGDKMGEGPKVFQWKEKYWMVTYVWRGLVMYESEDIILWNRISGNLLK